MSPLSLFGAILGVGVVLLVSWRVARSYLKLCGVRLVSCPQDGTPAAVDIDAWHAAWTTSFGKTDFRLQNCSYWPDRKECGRSCILQIAEAPEDCLVRTILSKWYQRKSCVLCAKPLEEISWLQRKPTLMGPDRITFEWTEIRPDRLPEILRTHVPTCWDCHIAETFRRQFPELVTDRLLKTGDGPGRK